MRSTILVSGPPGAGKTTLARPLAQKLGFALLSKDDIKEALYAALGGTAGNVPLSQRTSAAAMEVLWALAEHCPQVVLEANFRTSSEQERARVRALDGRVIEVHCRVPLDEASRRFALRSQTERHHPAHPLGEMSLDQLAKYADPFALTPVIDVDTTTPVDLEVVLQKIRDIWR